MMFVLTALTGCAPPPHANLARDGLLDLREMAPSPIRLDGEWQWVPGRLVEPEDFHPGAADVRTVDVPATWGSAVRLPGEPVGHGRATYRLRILLPRELTDPGLRLTTLATAFRLYADGTLIASAGRLDKDPAGPRPEYAPQINALPATDDGSVEIVLQISNHHYARGGLWKPIWIGPLPELHERREARVALTTLLLGAFGIMGLYHLMLWAAHRSDRSSLLFALLSFGIGVRGLTVEEVYLIDLLPDLSWSMLIRLEYASMLACLAFGWGFVRELFPREFPLRVVAAFVIVPAISVGLIMVLPVTVFSAWLPLFLLILALAVLVAPFLLLRALLHHREGAGLFLVGTLAIVFTTFHDILISLDRSLWTLEIFDGQLYLQPFGLLVFMLSQSVMLALRSSRMVAHLEHTSEALRQARDRLDTHARELESRVAERTESLEEANRRLERLVQIDGLTGIGNRRFFDEQLDVLWRDHRRRGASLALVMIDIDQFKRFNDDHGHVAGDEALRVVASELEQTLQRPRDLVARYGGEELAVLLPDTDLDGALWLAERMRAGIEALGIPQKTGDQPVVTISLGVASEVPGPDRSAQKLVESADAALYRAKELGRNRVEAAAQTPD